MKKIYAHITMLLALSSSPVFAAESTKTKPLPSAEIAERLQVKAQIYVLDKTGERLLNAPVSYSDWRSSGGSAVESNWGSGNNFGQINIHHKWEVNNDSSISVLIEEYAGSVDDPKTGRFLRFDKLLKRLDTKLKNFEPITWKVNNIKDRHVVVRFSPSLEERVEPEEAIDLPLAGHNVIITDNLGRIWNSSLEFRGKYIATKAAHGTLAISFKPFEKAEGIGEALGDVITLRLPDDLEVYLRSDTPFLPAGVSGKIYGRYIPGLKSDSFRSAHVWSSSSEEGMTRHLSGK